MMITDQIIDEVETDKFIILRGNMDKYVVAFATDDGVSFNSRHFGDTERFYIYEINREEATLIKILENSSAEEQMHADPIKAKSVSTILQKENVSIAVSKVFGPNINRIKKKFVCLMIQAGNINNAIEKIQLNWDSILDQIGLGKDRNYLTL